nr:hypothetical protein [Tanacetum cinerariifolium]
DLTEMELKKILIEKMEGNKSIQRSDKQRNLYKALVDAYEADKTILESYGDTTEGPSAGSDRGSKRRREGGEPESASTLSKPTTRSAGRSTTGTQSGQMSASALTELEYHLEEVYKATTDQLDWVNPEGQHDETLNDVRNTLDDRLKGIRMQYLPQAIWRKGDKYQAAVMIQSIDKMLKTRRIMRSLEWFVGGRLTNFNQEQPYQATTQSNQNFHLNELEKIKRMNDVSLKAMQNQIDMVKNKLRNEMKTSIQTSLSNQTNEINNLMASLLQMNTTFTSRSGSLSGNTVANPKGKLKAITTRSGLATDGPTIPTLPKSVNPEEDECVEETYMDPDLAKYTIKVTPPPVQKPKPLIQRHFVLHTKDSPPPHIPYPSRMLKQKQQEKDDIQIQKF